MSENQTKISAEEKESRLSLGDIFKILKEGLVWIILITILFATLGVAYAFGYKKTTYTARVDAYLFTDKLYTEETGANGEDISEHIAYQYCSMLVPQISKVFKSNEVLAEVSKSGIKLKGSINFITNEDSPYFSITYTYKQHGGDAEAIKYEVAKTLNDYVDKAVETINSGDIKAGYLKDKIVVYSDAAPMDITASTGRFKTVALMTAIGLVVAVIFVLIKRLLSDTVMTKEQVEQITSNQIIATVDISANFEQREKSDKGGNE